MLIESGVSWLPAFCWRLSKFWRGLRIEVPWVDRAPVEIVREHVRLTLQPFDAPPSADAVARLLEHLGSDEMLLFSSDYPHWHFDGDDVLPEGLPDAPDRSHVARNPRTPTPDRRLRMTLETVADSKPRSRTAGPARPGPACR